MSLVLFNAYIEPLSSATTPGQSGLRSNGTTHSPKLQHCWNLTIRLFSVISRTLVGGSYPYAEVQSVYFTASADREIF